MNVVSRIKNALYPVFIMLPKVDYVLIKDFTDTYMDYRRQPLIGGRFYSSSSRYLRTLSVFD